MNTPIPEKPALVEKLAYSLADLCAGTGLSRVTVYRLEKRGLLKSVAGVRHKLYARREVERFLSGRGAEGIG